MLLDPVALRGENWDIEREQNGCVVTAVRNIGLNCKTELFDNL
jgi:hypothetical protein